MIRLLACLAATSLASLIGVAHAAADGRLNVFNMTTGAVVLSARSYDESTWSAFNLFDENPKSLWCSPEGKPRANEIVLELSQRHRLETIAFDNTEVQEGKYPGVSARTVEVWTSTTAADSGFRKAATLEAPKGARKEFALPEGTLAEWVKLVIVDNWGSSAYTELAEVQAQGVPMGDAPPRLSISGVYQTNYGALQLEQKGDRVTGCYYGGEGTISGVTDGRVANLEWRQKGQRSGVVLMVLTTRGDALNGLWYEGGGLKGTWSGKRDPKAGNACKLAGSGLAADLKQSGRAIAYGIHFKSDSDVLTAESGPVLDEIAALLKASPALRVRVEGHTDATNTDAYNLDLSQRRARSVLKWLKDHGVGADRLAAEGYGKARPVADNATPQGRALNRRVELTTQP